MFNKIVSNEVKDKWAVLEPSDGNKDYSIGSGDVRRTFIFLQAISLEHIRKENNILN